MNCNEEKVPPLGTAHAIWVVMERTIAQMIQARTEKAQQGNWVPANGGTETPFLTRSGRTLLYCWQATTGRHAYLDCGTDLILDDTAATILLGF